MGEDIIYFTPEDIIDLVTKGSLIKTPEPTSTKLYNDYTVIVSLNNNLVLDESLEYRIFINGVIDVHQDSYSLSQIYHVQKDINYLIKDNENESKEQENG